VELSSLCGCLRLKGRVSFRFDLHYDCYTYPLHIQYNVIVTHVRYTCPLHIQYNVIVTHVRYTCPLHMPVTHVRYTCPLHLIVQEKASTSIHFILEYAKEGRRTLISSSFVGFYCQYHCIFTGFSVGNLLEEEKINRIFNFMWEGMWRDLLKLYCLLL
jgi:hypothetical protein